MFDVRRDTIIEPGGVRATRDIVVHNGSIVVLPIFDDGRLLLIRQYRHSVGGYLWELVAGWEKILDLFPTPGFVSERMVIYVARDLRAGTAHPEDDERITVRAFAPRQIETWIRTGELRDAKSVAAILYYLRFCRRVAP